MNKKYILFALLTLSCTPKADTKITEIENTATAISRNVVTNSPRISVIRIAVIEDPIAYNSVRGVYLIKDNQTGLSYFGVSGIGISEVGSHLASKTAVEDER